jgi:hypothetical protein
MSEGRFNGVPLAFFDFFRQRCDNGAMFDKAGFIRYAEA